MGAASGVNFAALEPRLRTIVLLEAGIMAEKAFPGTSAIDFAPRVKQPVLMINGTYDQVWVGYKELYQLLGTPAADKSLREFQTGHAVGDRREDMVSAVTGWLDKYLGPVN
jgi:predicted esterase